MEAKLRDALDRPLGRFFALSPSERLVDANTLVDELKSIVSEISDDRRVAVRELRLTGYTFKEIAEIAGTTPQRIQQIETGYNRREKAARKVR